MSTGRLFVFQGLGRIKLGNPVGTATFYSPPATSALQSAHNVMMSVPEYTG